MTRTLRVLRQIVAPNGKHRPRRAVLLPDQPVTLSVDFRGLVDEAELERQLDADEIATHEDTDCPKCGRTTAHAVNRDQSRRCWDCGTTTPGEATDA
jgi:tRNA(Ile2) C34 agmatinyltransferase TiaS